MYKYDVSVVIPIKNEIEHIKYFIDSLNHQQLFGLKCEFILIDGNSNDGTFEFLNKNLKSDNRFTILQNINGITPVSLNLGINIASGEFIVRMDAHSVYPYDYVSKLVNHLKTGQYENVGGKIVVKGKTNIGKMYEIVLESKFGVGNSSFRTSSKSGIVDTVPFGAFRKDKLIEIGLYNEKLSRNQDIELNYRIRKNNGKIFLDTSILITYFCRNKFSEIIKQSYENGKWNIILTKINKNALSMRHYVPLLFVVYLISNTFLWIINLHFIYLLMVILLIYFSLGFYFSIKGLIRKKYSLVYLIILPFIFLSFHIGYGIGSLIGILKIGDK